MFDKLIDDKNEEDTLVKRTVVLTKNQKLEIDEICEKYKKHGSRISFSEIVRNSIEFGGIKKVHEECDQICAVRNKSKETK